MRDHVREALRTGAACGESPLFTVLGRRASALSLIPGQIVFMTLYVRAPVEARRRGSTVFGLLVGWLAAAQRQLQGQAALSC